MTFEERRQFLFLRGKVNQKKRAREKKLRGPREATSKAAELLPLRKTEPKTITFVGRTILSHEEKRDCPSQGRSEAPAGTE